MPLPQIENEQPRPNTLKTDPPGKLKDLNLSPEVSSNSNLSKPCEGAQIPKLGSVDSKACVSLKKQETMPRKIAYPRFEKKRSVRNLRNFRVSSITTSRIKSGHEFQN